jgi:hypothetical protein
MIFKNSNFIEGYIGLFEKDEMGSYEEVFTFSSIESAQIGIDTLQRTLDKLKKSPSAGEVKGRQK